MKSKGIEAMRLSGNRGQPRVEAHADNFRVGLRVWSDRMAENVMLTPDEARNLAMQLITAADRIDATGSDYWRI